MRTLGISAGCDGTQHRQHRKDPLEPEAARIQSFAAFMRQENPQQRGQSCAEAAKEVLVGFAAGTAWEHHG